MPGQLLCIRMDKMRELICMIPGDDRHMKTLETDRLILRNWRDSGIGCEVFNESTIRYLIAAKNNYAVALKENDTAIGTTGLNEDADGIKESLRPANDFFEESVA